MGRKSLVVNGYTPSEIKALFSSEDKYKIGIRLYAVYQVSLGHSSRKLEELYNTSYKQITNWVHRFESEGIEGLKDKPGRGRTSRLTKDQETELQDLLQNKSPIVYGFNTETWTGPLLIDWIFKNFGISYKKAQIYNIIKDLGFSHQKAKGYYPEADAQKQKEFKDHLKKTS